jgi:hypothetical protein
VFRDGSSARGTCAIRLTRLTPCQAGGCAAGVAGDPRRTTSGGCIAGDPGVTGLAQASSLLGRPVKDCSASRFRQPSHHAPAGGVRCDRGSSPAPRHFHATRDRAPARCGNAERHPALAPASPADRRRARDSREARRMDALALAINGSAPAVTVLRACDESPRIHARPPGRSNIAAPPCPAMPSRHVRCPTRPHAIAKRDG